jgi:uncharacterized membrane protein
LRTSSPGRSASWPPFLVAALLLGAVLVSLEAVARLAPASPAGAAARVALRPACHQRAERSFAVAGVALPACARCTGVHLSAFAGALAAWALGRRVKWTHAACAGALLAVDAGTGIVSPSWDHPWLRFTTGLVAGAAVFAAAAAHPTGD